MKINPARVYQAYNTAKYNKTPRQTGFHLEEVSSRNEHTDQIQISVQGSRKAEENALTKAIMNDNGDIKNCDVLEDVKAAVENKSYYVPTDDLVEAVMNKWLFI